MNRLVTTVLGQKVPNVLVTYLQDLTVAQRPAQYGDLTAMTGGAEVRLWQATADLTNTSIANVDTDVVKVINTGVTPNTLVDGAFSWYDREVFGVYRAYGGADQRPGQANDYLFDQAAPVLFWGYFGKGALAAASAPVTATVPPVPAWGSSWAVQIGYPTTTGLWLYVDPADGELKLYNNTGSTQRTPSLWLIASAATGKRPV